VQVVLPLVLPDHHRINLDAALFKPCLTDPLAPHLADDHVGFGVPGVHRASRPRRQQLQGGREGLAGEDHAVQG